MNKGLTITLVATTLLLTVAVAGIGAYVFLFQPTASAEEKHTEEAPEVAKVAAETFYFKPSKFLTNLADKDRLRYVELSIALAMKDAAALETAKKIEPKIRDVVLDKLRQQVAADFAGAEGKAKLAETLQAGLNEILKGYLTKVYVTDLVVQ